MKFPAHFVIGVPTDVNFAANASLGQLALHIRSELKAGRTPEHVKSYAYWWKTSVLGVPQRVVSAAMHPVGISNITSARFFDLDFSAAAIPSPNENVVDEADDAGPPAHLKPVRPVDMQARISGHPYLSFSWIVGKDENGSYKLNCCLMKEQWLEIEKRISQENAQGIFSGIRSRL